MPALLKRAIGRSELKPHADTEDEKDKFFDDAMSLAVEMTDGQTFADHLPLMNYWAGFSASKEVR